MELVADLTLIILSAIAGAFLAQRFRQPLIVGYILAGVAVGPFTGGLTVASVHDVEQLSELGVVLLLFSLGLEVSFRELSPVRTVALAGGALQIVLTIAFGFGIGRLLGWSSVPAVWFGALISMSSTMVALKTIQAQGRLGTLSSRVMLGMLVFQDLAVVPLTIILPELSNPAAGLLRVEIAAGRAAVLLAVIVLVSTKLVPRIMAFVAQWNSRELFLLTTVGVAVGVAYATWAFGISLALGAFVAGLVVNESEYAHQALSDVIPLRDVFGMLFFVSVGMLLDPTFLWRHPVMFLTAVAAVVIGKAGILAGVVRLFGYRNVIPLATGLTLFQVGEFAFVLASVGRASGAINSDLYALALSTAIATMVVTPVLSGLTPVIYERFRHARGQESLQTINVPEGGMADHVVIAGSGRVGRSIADALAPLHLPFVLVELDDRRVQQARAAGLPIVYGDAAQSVVLEAAGIDRARAMLVTVSALADARAIVTTVRRLRPELPIIARAEGGEGIQALYALGIQEVASPEYEAAIEMARQALAYFNMPAHEILQVASGIRRHRYGLVDGAVDSGLALMTQISDVARQLDFTWIGVPVDSPLIGRTLADLRLRNTVGVSVVGVIRTGVLQANPDGDMGFERGDLVAVLGTRDQIAGFEVAVRSGSGEPRG
ncbi:MAG TPA: cation:proton antiporter [Vicinamibacterales bacterium]|jgi:CPA2 family monovalent cation:H+ antiporter-2